PGYSQVPVPSTPASTVESYTTAVESSAAPSTTGYETVPAPTIPTEAPASTPLFSTVPETPVSTPIYKASPIPGY
ncbi:hypothetical protein GGI12_003014, partial [Dipsacomyces acuminosporus]